MALTYLYRDNIKHFIYFSINRRTFSGKYQKIRRAYYQEFCHKEKKFTTRKRQLSHNTNNALAEQETVLGIPPKAIHKNSMNSMKLVIPLHSLYWSIHTKDESKRGTAFAFIFGVN